MPSDKNIVEEVRTLLDGITAGPWVASGNGIHKGIHAVATTHAAERLQRCADARFIARSPELLRALADEVEQLRQSAAQLSRCTSCERLAVQRLCKLHGGIL